MLKKLMTMGVAVMMILNGIGFVGSGAKSGTVNAVELRTQGMENPLGIGTKAPELSWKLSSVENNQAQTAYEIQASLNESFGNIVWESGKVESPKPFGAVYGGGFEDGQEVFWHVRLMDKDGNWGEFSETASFEFGIRNWDAKWLKAPKTAATNIFETSFSAEKPVKKARLYASALGIFEASLNGKKIGDDFFAPGETDFRKRVHYVTYDVTDLLKSGENTVSIELGRGMYGSLITSEDSYRYRKSDGEAISEGLLGDELKCMAQLEIIYQDGEKLTVATDKSWNVRTSATTVNNWYGGEDFDASAVGETSHATETSAPAAKLEAKEYPGIKIQESYQAVSVVPINTDKYRLIGDSSDEGYWLIDMGRNGAGIEELILENTENMKGWTFKMYPAEITNDDNTVNQDSCTQRETGGYITASGRGWGPIFDTYTVSGTGSESWHPRFCYHGYRYLEVHIKDENGIGVTAERFTPTTANFKNHLLWTDNENTGSFDSSSDDINVIDTIITRSLQSQMMSVFTDCPQIEKLGWLEQYNLMFHSYAANFDIRAWYKKLIRDVMDAQYEAGEFDNGNSFDTTNRRGTGPKGEGYIPTIAPGYRDIEAYDDDPNWSGVIATVPYDYYMIYGDTSLMEEAYEGAKAYVEYLRRKAADTQGANANSTGDNLIWSVLGDWAAEDGSTPQELVVSCAYYEVVDTVAKTAKILGKAEDEEKYLRLSNDIKAAINSTYYDEETGLYGSGSQASLSCPLDVGVVEEENVERVLNNLIDAIASYNSPDRGSSGGYHLSTGEIGLKHMINALTKYGRSDVLYKMCLNKTYPSYLYFVENNATTLIEYWDMQKGRSQNHAMLGHIEEWLSHSLAGIHNTAPGYEKIAVKPYIPDDLDRAEASTETPYGTLSNRWEKQNGRLYMTTVIPAGTEAKISLPEGLCENISINGEEVGGSVTVGGGKYEITADLMDMGSAAVLEDGRLALSAGEDSIISGRGTVAEGGFKAESDITIQFGREEQNPSAYDTLELTDFKGEIKLYLGDKLCASAKQENKGNLRIPAKLDGSGIFTVKAAAKTEAGAMSLAGFGKIIEYGNAVMLTTGAHSSEGGMTRFGGLNKINLSEYNKMDVYGSGGEVTVTSDGQPFAKLRLASSKTDNVTDFDSDLTGAIAILPSTDCDYILLAKDEIVPNGELENLAFEKTVIYSESEEQFANNYRWSASYLTDGRFDTGANDNYGYTSYRKNSPKSEIWVGVDLGKELTFNDLKLYPRSFGNNAKLGFPVDFEIQVSDDGKAWKTVKSFENYILLGSKPVSFMFDTVSARYVRILATKLDPTGYLQIIEMQVFNNIPAVIPDNETENLALNKTVIYSESMESFASNYRWSAPYLTDGRFDIGEFENYGYTSNHKASQNAAVWVGVDLGAKTTFDDVKLFPRAYGSNGGSGFPRNFKIQVSNDKNNWTDVVERKNYCLPNFGPQRFMFEPVSARYVRVLATKLDPTMYLQLIEMEIYSTSKPDIEITDFSVKNGQIHYSYVCNREFENVYAVIYGGDGKMLYMSKNKSDEFAGLEPEGKYKLKVMAWNENLVPLCRAAEAEI